MHTAIDILALIVLIFFFCNGWRRGFAISVLGIVRIIVALAAARFLGEWLGTLLADKLQKPRLVTWFICGMLSFAIITFAFRILITALHDRNKQRKEKEGKKLNFISCLSGGLLSMITSAFTLILLYWLAELSLAVFLNTGIPGGEQSRTGPIVRRTMYELTYRLAAREGRENQAAATARMMSDPADGFTTLEAVMNSDSVQKLLTSPEFTQDFLSGDAHRVENSAEMQQFFADSELHEHLKQLGIMSQKGENRDVVSERIAAIGAKLQTKLEDEKIQACLTVLKEKEMLSPEKIPELVRDPYFLYILDTLLKETPETENESGSSVNESDV